MKKHIFLLTIITLSACNKTADKKTITPPTPKLETYTQDRTAETIQTPVISQEYLSGIGLYFGSEHDVLSLECLALEGLTNIQQRNGLEKFLKDVTELNRSKSLKWFMGEKSNLIYESYDSYTANEIESAIKKTLESLKSNECPTNSSLRRYKYFESRTKYKTNLCFSKTDALAKESYLVALDSEDVNQNIYFNTSVLKESCLNSLNWDIFPSHRFFSKNNTYEEFHCYKDEMNLSSYYLLKEILTKDTNELLELIIKSKYDNIEVCEFERARQ
jgi:hypothetical protein